MAPWCSRGKMLKNHGIFGYLVFQQTHFSFRGIACFHFIKSFFIQIVGISETIKSFVFTELEFPVFVDHWGSPDCLGNGSREYIIYRKNGCQPHIICGAVECCSDSLRGWLNMLKPQMCPTAWLILICQVPSIQQQSTKPAHIFSMFFLKVEYRGFHKGGYPNSWKRMETPINIWMILGGTPHDLGNLHMLGVSTCFFPAFIMVSQAR